MSSGVAHLESLLRARKLDGAVASTRPLPVDRVAQTGLASLDARLGGGLVRGHLSEIVGPRSSGRSSLLCAALAAATSRGEVVALIDACDSFDPIMGEAAGIDLSRVLWVRGHQASDRTMSRCVIRAVKAAGLVFQAGRFGVVAVDVAEVPPVVLKRLPLATWLRLARAIEGSETVGLLVGPHELGRSAAGRSIILSSSTPASAARWAGGGRSRRLRGLGFTVRVESARQTSQPFQLWAEPHEV